MKRTIQTALACLILGAAPVVEAAQIVCAGVLGNSGEQGATLVRFGTGTARGLGTVVDDAGSIWDRGGEGTLNRYAADGRLLASYKIPGGPGDNDRMTRAGKLLILLLSGHLYSLPTDAPPGTAATPMGVTADLMSLSTVDGCCAIGTVDRKEGSWSLSLFNPATKEITPAASGTADPPREVELGPGNALYANMRGKLVVFQKNGEVASSTTLGAGPGDRLQYIEGFLYGSVWHGTIRRFATTGAPDPGVTLGGGSGSFIGHVDGNTEVEFCRGLAKLYGDLFAASGMDGILHLLRWESDRQRFVIVRRIGAVPACNGLGINRKGQIWFWSGVWDWEDGPDAKLHDCVGGVKEAQDTGQVVTLPNDNFVMPEIRSGHLNVIGGPFSWNVYGTDFRTGTPDSDFLCGSAVYQQDKILVLLTINKQGQGRTFRIDNAGRTLAPLGSVNLEPTTPVTQWTSLAMKDKDTLLGAGDGYVIEMARDGVNWKETRRWNSWRGAGPSSFGSRIYIAGDAGSLWVSDTEHQRVLSFGPGSEVPAAGFGATDQAGSDLAHLDTPCCLAVSQGRAVVFDSGNQRLMKLSLAQ